MGLLKEAESTTAFFKCGMLGFQGSGKTYTAALLAIGICQAIKAQTLAFFDTETGSDFLLPMLEQAGLKLFHHKSRAFGDLLQVIDECSSNNIPMLIIDSITHVWRDLCDAYDKKLKRKGRLQFQDWAVLKGEWKEYTDLFVNSPLHIVVCGRAGYEYDYDYNEDGTKDLIKTGTRMKVESEFGFEPSLVIEMERVTPSKQIMDELKDIKDTKLKRQRKQTFKPQVGSKWIHRAHVLKDRADVMNGQSFDNPTFKNFKPHFEFLNIGGEHLGVDVTRTSEDRFDIEGRPEWKKDKVQKDIALEEIQATMVNLWLSTSANDKKSKADFLEAVFNTRSWTAVQEQSLTTLQNVVSRLKDFEHHYHETDPADVNIKGLWDTLGTMKEAVTPMDDIPDFKSPNEETLTPEEVANSFKDASEEPKEKLRCTGCTRDDIMPDCPVHMPLLSPEEPKTAPPIEDNEKAKGKDRVLRSELKKYAKADFDVYTRILKEHKAGNTEQVIAEFSEQHQKNLFKDLEQQIALG